MEDCIFCKIIAGKELCYTVYEDNVCKAFLDRRPVRKGTVLVVPKHHVDHAMDLDDGTASHMIKVCNRIARHTKKAVKPECKKVILNHLANGKPYIGVSAGSCVLGSDIIQLETIGMDENLVNISNTKGYSVINKKIIPHYEPKHLEFLNHYNEDDYLLLNDGEAVALEYGKNETRKIDL